MIPTTVCVLRVDVAAGILRADVDKFNTIFVKRRIKHLTKSKPVLAAFRDFGTLFFPKIFCLVTSDSDHRAIQRNTKITGSIPGEISRRASK